MSTDKHGTEGLDPKLREEFISAMAGPVELDTAPVVEPTPKGNSKPHPSGRNRRARRAVYAVPSRSKPYKQHRSGNKRSMQILQGRKTILSFIARGIRIKLCAQSRAPSEEGEVMDTERAYQLRIEYLEEVHDIIVEALGAISRESTCESTRSFAENTLTGLAELDERAQAGFANVPKDEANRLILPGDRKLTLIK